MRRVYRFTFPLDARTELGVGERKVLTSPVGPHTKPYPPNKVISNEGTIVFISTYLTPVPFLNVFNLSGEKRVLFIDPYLLGHSAWQTEAH